MPHDTSSFEFHEGPVLLIGEASSANVDDCTDGAVRLFLFKCGSKAVGAGIFVQTERSSLVQNCVPIRGDKYWRGCDVREECTNDFFHFGSRVERSAFLE